jgi:hypothetical protein
MPAKALALLFATAVTLHDIEEALFLPAWIRTHLKVRFKPNPRAYWIVTSLVSIIVWIAALGPATPSFHLALSGFALAMAINAFVPHLMASAIKRSYSPGTATAVFLNLPLAVMVIGVESKSGLASPVSFWLETVGYAALLGVVSLGSLYAMHAVFNKCGKASTAPEVII